MINSSYSERSSFFPANNLPVQSPISKAPALLPKYKAKSKLRPESPATGRAKQADLDGIPDVYRRLLDEVEQAGPDGTGFQPFHDRMSPDWRAGHQMLRNLLDEWSAQPSYIPRCGELVLFTRTVSPDEGLAWHSQSRSLRRIDRITKTWLDRPKWEVGVVTQLPIEALSADDLEGIPQSKQQGIAYSGFRVEPLNRPGIDTKASSGQHKYVPLHAIRPFIFWKDCVGPASEAYHPTIQHALTVASSFSIIGRSVYHGVWPAVTLYAKGLYLGPELIMTGDAVRISLATPDSRQDGAIDVMVVSSIRLRFVNLEEATDDDYDESRPYNTCLHVSGRLYSLDPKRSFGGIGKSPVKGGWQSFPSGLLSYGTWFHVNNPQNPKEKMEIPYTRVLGRCPDYHALQMWFSTPSDMTPEPSFQAVNTTASKPLRPTLSQGVRAIQEARTFSTEHDKRIDEAGGKKWFWAETRIEQLDLHEINGKFVGVKDDNRTKKQIHAWRQALKVLDGKRGGIEHYQAALKMREVEKRESGHVPAAFGMMAIARQEDSATEMEGLEGLEGANMMDVKHGAEVEQEMEEMPADQLRSNEQEDADDDDVMILE